MQTWTITPDSLRAYAAWLLGEERSRATVEKYRRDTADFAAWLGAAPLTRSSAAGWKRALQGRGLKPATVNAKLAAVNGLLKFLGRGDCKARLLRLQRRVFRDSGRQLTRAEYGRLVSAAQARRPRLALLLQTICGTGVRVSEVAFITVEAARRGRADVALKGKVRTILLPGKLCRKLLAYARQQKIASGAIFRTESGHALSRKTIWAEMKSLCRAARVEPGKVFPHNLRHLFAVEYYRACRNLVQLADILGHSSIETTRIYLLTDGAEHARRLEHLGLVV